MKRHGPAAGLPKFIDEMSVKQRNIVFPEGLANGAAVDKFLLLGSPNPPLVQRVAAWLFGLIFLMAGAFFLDYAQNERSLLAALMSLGSFLLGAKVFRNGFRRRSAGARSKHS